MANLVLIVAICTLATLQIHALDDNLSYSRVTITSKDARFSRNNPNATIDDINSVGIQQRASRYIVGQSDCDPHRITTCRKIPRVKTFCSFKEDGQRIVDAKSMQYVQLADNTVYGDKKACKRPPIDASKNRISISGAVFEVLKKLISASWFQDNSKADYMCNCNRDDTFRKLCLNRQHASPGHVATGVQLVNNAGIFMIQIEQGKFNVTSQKVDENSHHWLPLGQCEQTGDLNDDSQLHLDQIVSLNGLLAGIHFARAGPNSYKLAISAKTVITGDVNDDRNVALSDEVTYITYNEARRPNSQKVNVSSVLPQPLTGETQMLSGPGDHFQFTRTSFESDLAQSVVPYFDKQYVVATTEHPLTGARFVLKGQRGISEYFGIELISSYTERTLEKDNINIARD